MSRSRALRLVLPFVLALTACRGAGVHDTDTSAGRARLDRRLEQIFLREDFTPRTFGPARWLDATHYATVEASTSPAGGQDLVSYDAESGVRVVLIPAERLVP